MYLVQQHPRGRGQQLGVALLEVLFVLGLSSVMFLALFTAQVHSQKVLIYSQQLHHASRILSQVSKHVWAYPQHYHDLVFHSAEPDAGCFTGRYCTPQKMTHAWSELWQSLVQQQLPNGELSVFCVHGCTPGGTVSVRLQWTQKLALATDQCPQEVACMQLNIAL